MRSIHKLHMFLYYTWSVQVGPRNAATKSGHRTQVRNVHVAKPPRFTYDLRAQAQRAMWTGGIALLKVATATWASRLRTARVKALAHVDCGARVKRARLRRCYCCYVCPVGAHGRRMARATRQCAPLLTLMGPHAHDNNKTNTVRFLML